VLQQSLQVNNCLNKNFDCLYATLLILYESEKNWNFLINGDGIGVFVRKDGTLKVIEVEYPSQAPRYLIYRSSDEIYQKFSQFDRGKVIKEFDIDKDGIQRLVSVKRISNRNNMGNKYKDWDLFSFNNEEFPIACIFSDGIKSFNEDFIKVAYEFCKIKNTVGEFIQRRSNKFFHKTCKKNDWSHYDDFSVAGICK
jgi:hypothetical protein